MNILLVVPQDEENGGVASVVGNLGRYLTHRGHRVFFFHPAAGIFLKRKTNRLGFSSFYCRLQMPFGERHPAVSLAIFLVLLPVVAFQLILLLRRNKIEIVNIHYPADSLVYFALGKRLLGLPLVTSIHGADIFPDGSQDGRRSRAMQRLLSSSDLIVAPSKQFQQDFVTAFPLFSAKTRVIHNGIDLAEFGAADKKPRDPAQAPYIVCISAYKKQKALDVLIRAFKSVLEAYPALNLILVGAGPLRESLKDLAVSLGIEERIAFLGTQTRAEVAELLRNCEAFVLPSRFETFGIVILEAMAFEKPVIATTAGGIPEIIENGESGILVPPDDSGALADAIIAVLRDRALRSKIARNGYTRVKERYGSENTGAKYEADFDALVHPPLPS
ncbi:MAG: glycosyltransferase family 4 protein, partial [Chloroflexota bacterium]